MQDRVRCAILEALLLGERVDEAAVAARCGADFRDVRAALAALIGARAVVGAARWVPFGATPTGPLRVTAIGRRLLEDCASLV